MEKLVYDYSDGEINPDNLPDPNQILDQVLNILEYIATPDLKLIRESDPKFFESLVEEKFPEFTDRYYGIFKMLLSGSDLSPLFAMLSGINHIKTGQKKYRDCRV